MGCPFCAIPPERIVAQDDLTQTIRDGFPVSPGHTLVIPRRHVRSLFETTGAERKALWSALVAAREALATELDPGGWNIGVNDGAAAGQTVDHLHVHLIPRFAGDTSNPRGGVRNVIPGKGDYQAGAISR